MRSVMLMVLAAASSVGKSTVDDSSPISKVVKLLKDMQGQLMTDKKDEEEMYDKLSCWCKVNGDGKEGAVEVATASISSLDSLVESLAAKNSELEMSIKTLGEEIAANTASLDSATKMRGKEAAEFHSNDKDMTLSIDSLKHAVVVLSKSQGESFLQVGESTKATSMVQVKASLRDVVATADNLLDQILSPSDRDAVTAFVQAPAHTPASGEIMGVLKQMKENFEGNHKDMTKEEATAAAEFLEMEAAKKSEIAAGEQLVKEKTAQLGRSKVARAEAKEDLQDTSDALEADQAFLVDLKKRCSSSDAEWEKRSKTRALEIQAVSETINILSADDSHDLFHKTMGFLQLSSTRRVANKAQLARESASRILMRQASKTGNKALVQLASSAHLDGFKEVSQAINGMVADLKKESADEIKHKDWCNTAFQENEMETMRTDSLIKDLSTKIDDLASKMDTLDGEIAALKASLADSHVELQRANENRVKQNQEFQQTVGDQRATQVILKKALDRLSKFYEEQFLQVSAAKRLAPGEAAPPPPADPAAGEYKANAGAGGVTTMIGNIINDAAEMEKEAIESENDAQAAYEAFTADTFTSIADAQRATTNKVEQRAKAESSKVATEGDKAAALQTSEGLAKTLAETHSACDFVLQNFEVKQAARVSEVDGLTDALAALKSS